MIKPVDFFCGNNNLKGILHIPDIFPYNAAVIIVTGGPQTRTGSHRLYVQLAQYLSSNGIAVLRFDYEGLGDSEGPSKGFNYAVPSIDAAVEYMASTCFNATPIFLWSICDGCLPSLWYSKSQTSKIYGLILCNPFVMSDPERSSLKLRQYYFPRLFQKTTWMKALKRELNFMLEFANISSHLINLLLKLISPEVVSHAPEKLKSVAQFTIYATHNTNYVSCFLSENDLIAKNLFDFLNNNHYANQFYSENRFMYKIIPNADHTFTSFQSKNDMFKSTLISIRHMISANDNTSRTIQ